MARTISSDPSVGTLGRTQTEVKQIESNLRDGELDSVLRNFNAEQEVLTDVFHHIVHRVGVLVT